MAVVIFTEWLKTKTEGSSVGWANPNIRQPASSFNGRPRMDAIHQFIQKTIEHGADPVQSMNNIAANANMHDAPDYHQGDEPPLNWKMLNIIRTWGFGDQDQFGEWWTKGGRQLVQQATEEIWNKDRLSGKYR